MNRFLSEISYDFQSNFESATFIMVKKGLRLLIMKKINLNQRVFNVVVPYQRKFYLHYGRCQWIIYIIQAVYIFHFNRSFGFTTEKDARFII